MSPWCPLLLALCVGIWLAVFDADFITFSYDLHRQTIGNNNIANKSVWIVGASSGIGEYLVYELIQSGCNKLILSSRREKQLERVKTEALTLTNNKDIEIIIKPLDLHDFATKDGYSDKFVQSLMKDISFNKIDILVVNSGMIQMGWSIDNKIDILQRILDINTIGPVALIQSMVKYWQKTDPKHNNNYQIALTSSIAGITGSPGQAAYAMSKFGVNGYLATLRMELIGDNIDVNIIYPGHIEIPNQYSQDSMGSSLKQKKIVRGSGGKNRMKMKRCVQLYVTALEYSISESVMSTHPVLAFTYVKQYLPGIWNPIIKLVLPIFDPHYKKSEK